MARLGRRLQVPVRSLDDRIRYCGDFYGQAETGEPLPELIAPAALVRLLEELPAGTTELGCHPANGAVDGTSYAAERELELVALCAPSVCETVTRVGIELCSFADVGR